MNINLKCKKEPFEIKPNKEKANKLMYMYMYLIVFTKTTNK